MKQSTPLIYSTHSRWYVSTPRAVDRRGCLRCALLIRSPHHDDLLYVDLPSGNEEECAESGAALVTDLFRAEPWHRRPLQIRCGSIALTKALIGLIGEDTHVRTDAQARCFRASESEYVRHIMAEGFRPELASQ